MYQLRRLSLINATGIAWIIGEVNIRPRSLDRILQDIVQAIDLPSNVNRSVERYLIISLKMLVNLRKSVQIVAYTERVYKILLITEYTLIELWS